jgi:hypothetical protein
MANPEDFGPVARTVSEMINEARSTTSVELQISVHGDVLSASTNEALEYAITLNAALVGACMTLAAEVDDMRARLTAIENGEGPTIAGTKE